MIESARTGLYVALLFVLILMWQAWQRDFAEPVVQQPQLSTSSSPESKDMPVLETKPTEKVSQRFVQSGTSGQLIHVKTDVFDLKIDTLGGAISQLSLNKYPSSLGSEENVSLFQRNESHIYVAQSGLQGTLGPDTPSGPVVYQADQTNYRMDSEQEQLDITLMGKTPEGIKVAKRFTFHRGSYLIDISHELINQTDTIWQGRLYSQLKRSKVEKKRGFFSFPTYTGAAISSPDKRFEKITFDEMQSTQLNRQVTDGWIAMVEHYFLSAWVPDKETNYNFYTNDLGNNVFRVGLTSPWQQVLPNSSKSFDLKLYAGPEITSELEKIAPGLELTVDYGWFWPISQALFWILKLFHQLIGNWGVAIILVTMTIKLFFYKLSASSYRSMANMRRIQPKLMALKERHGQDKQKMSQEMMALYKKEKINPLGGCLPILIQIPVFIALYWVLIESVELRQAPFYLWIHDLSTKDPYYVLPLIMGLTMFLQQRLNPAPPDPMQAKMMMAMPFVFTLLFMSFPAGLMLYWVVNNSLSMTQQWFITRTVERSGSKK